MKCYIIIISLVFLCCLRIHAQDPNFSQYFSSPLTLNPANTGNFEGPIRLASNFRNQWQGVGAVFNTGTVSAEFALKNDGVLIGDRLSIGILGLYDRALDGGFSSNFFGPSLGYHLWLDADRLHKLSIGFQAILANKRIDPTRLTFASQFSSGGFDQSLPSDEFLMNQNINYLDWNTGLFYNLSTEGGSYYAGLSSYHITRPKESYFGDATTRLPFRLTINAGAVRYLGDRGILNGSIMHQRQGNTNQTIFGLAYGHFLTEGLTELTLYAGGWHRLNESIIPYLGLTYNRFHFGLSYDILLRQISQSSISNRSIELSVIYNFRDKSDLKKFLPWY